ncbi:uncharacterized protein AAG666_014963 [Megaptera novaeangliae]
MVKAQSKGISADRLKKHQHKVPQRSCKHPGQEDPVGSGGGGRGQPLPFFHALPPADPLQGSAPFSPLLPLKSDSTIGLTHRRNAGCDRTEGLGGQLEGEGRSLDCVTICCVSQKEEINGRWSSQRRLPGKGHQMAPATPAIQPLLKEERRRKGEAPAISLPFHQEKQMLSQSSGCYRLYLTGLNLISWPSLPAAIQNYLNVGDWSILSQPGHIAIANRI